MEENDALHIDSVSEVTEKIKDALEDSALLQHITVRGELSEIKQQKTKFNKNYYRFTLKDQHSQLSAVMFEGLDRMEFTPQKGDKVICEGFITVYEAYGQYQMKCFAMREDGVGDAAKALEKLKEKLRKEGLFSQHRELPRFPKKIAVVTSASGEAQHDIITTIEKRYPITKICFISAKVQGEGADESLCAGIRKAQTVGAELIIFGRGGGSAEDMECFNSEKLAREIFASKIPTISAVGHTEDHHISDDAADFGAKTPTEAAVSAVPDINDIRADIERIEQSAKTEVLRKLSDCANRLAVAERDVRLASPKERLLRGENELERLRTSINTAICARLDKAKSDLKTEMQRIVDTNPMTVLSRGYSYVTFGDKIISDADQLSVGDDVNIKLGKGNVTAKVTAVNHS